MNKQVSARWKAASSIILLTSIAAHHAAVAGAPSTATKIPGIVSEVTLYREQALVSRRIPVQGHQGALEIVVSELPEEIVSGSVFAEGPESVEIRAVRMRRRPVGEEPREEVRQLNQEIAKLEQKIAQNAAALERLARRTDYLNQLDGFVAPTAKTELSKGVLNAEALEKITRFSFQQRDAIGQQQFTLNSAAKALTDELQLLQRRRQALAGTSSRMINEAVLFIYKHDDNKQSIRLNYLVRGCGWSPNYTLRADQALKQVSVEYNAMIHQLSGEDWRDVKLSLSTASVALAASGPGLAPFHVALQSPTPKGPKDLESEDISERLQSYQLAQSAAITSNQRAISIRDNIHSSWGANTAATRISLLELTGGKQILNAEMAHSNHQGPSLSYELSSPVSLASRNDQQMVRVLKTTMASDAYHVATPVLTPFAYREAELINSSGQDLLAGPVTVYVNERFVGRGEIPTVTRGQAFIAGFGVNPQLRIRRELLERAENVQGGNRELRAGYRLVVENFNNEPVRLRLFDRLPYSRNAQDVRVTLDPLQDKLSIDQAYVRREQSKGILRWDLDVAAAATGGKARVVEYAYRMEFDKKFHLSAVGDHTKQLQTEFEKFQKRRLLLH